MSDFHPSQTTVRSFRIRKEQHEALKRLPASENASAIIRVLIQAWLDGRIDLDTEIAEEIQKAQQNLVAATTKKTKKAA